MVAVGRAVWSWLKSGESENHIKERLGLCSPIRGLPYTQQCPKMEASSEGTIDPNVLVLHRHVLKNGFVALLCGKRLSGPELCTLDMECIEALATWCQEMRD